jgi:anaerobic sulfite reductase subunit B
MAFVCGPEIMMRLTARELLGRGIDDIRISLERNMRCGVGWCGHCQLGPLLLCRDGPVVPYGDVARLLTVKEL